MYIYTLNEAKEALFEPLLPLFYWLSQNTLIGHQLIKQFAKREIVERSWGVAVVSLKIIYDLFYLQSSQVQILEAYRENIEAQSEETLRASMIAQVVLRFMEGRDEWSGSPTVLLSNLDSTAEGMGFSTNVKGWPKRAYILGRRLNELSPSLMNVGDIVFERGRTSRARQIRLIRAGKTSSGGVIGVMASQVGQERGAGSLESFTMRDSSLRGDLGRLLEEIHKLTLARGEDIVSIGDLGKGLGWDQETFDTVLAAAKRDSVVYEPQPGFLGVLR